MIQIKKISLLLHVVLLSTVVGYAQKFSESAILDTVKQTGFYSITVTPQLSSFIKTDFSDLRIADENGQYQPYIISTTTKDYHTSNYNKLQIIKNELQDSGRTVIIIKNNTGDQINNIALQIRNAAVSRNVTISGSDDTSRWFTIEENIPLETQSAIEKDHYIQTLDFPTSSYHYYKLVIENGKNDPLNIEEAGRYMSIASKTSSSYTSNPTLTFYQKDSSDRYSYIFIKEPYPFQKEKITIYVKGPRFFKRNIDLIQLNGKISGFQLLSDTVFSFFLPSFNDTNWLLRISNGDNPPLRIIKVYTGQETKSIVTYLDASKHYHLLLHDSLAVSPEYDLQQFKDSIPKVLPLLNILSYEKVATAHKKPASAVTDKLLWPVIIVAVILLTLLTFRLTRELQKRGHDNL